MEIDEKAIEINGNTMKSMESIGYLLIATGSLIGGVMLLTNTDLPS